MRYYARKLAFYLVALWAAVTLNFFIPRMMPGDPADILMAKLQQHGGGVDPAARRAYELLLGAHTDESLLSQYVAYLGNLLQGDFGISVSDFPTPVSTVIATSLPWTIALVGIATILAVVSGIVLGVFVGWRRGTWLDSLVPHDDRTVRGAVLLARAHPGRRPRLVAGLVSASGWVRRRHHPRPVQRLHRLRALPRHSARGHHRDLLGRRMGTGDAEHDGLGDGRGLRAHRQGEGPERSTRHDPVRGTERDPAVRRRIRDLPRLRRRQARSSPNRSSPTRASGRSCCRRYRTTTTRSCRPSSWSSRSRCSPPTSPSTCSTASSTHAPGPAAEGAHR